jgi:hypothetical protein
MGKHRIITLRNGTRVDMSTGEIISQGRPDYIHRRELVWMATAR